MFMSAIIDFSCYWFVAIMIGTPPDIAFPTPYLSLIHHHLGLHLGFGCGWKMGLGSMKRRHDSGLGFSIFDYWFFKKGNG